MVDEPDMRIGTPEREGAQQRLNEHFSLGRLDVAEFEERSTLVSGARTRADLEAVFQDLPATSKAGEDAPVAKAGERNLRYIVLGATPLVAVALFFVLGSVGVANAWLVFLLVPLSGIVLGGGNRDRREQRKIDRGND